MTISSVNDAPQANDDLATTSEDTPVLIDILANDTDTADVGGAVDPTSVTITTQPTQGTVTIDPATGELTFTPALNFHGADSLTYQVCDNGTPAQCATATVYLTISSVNDAPQANDDLATTSEDTPILIDILANDTDTADVGGAVDPTSVTIVTQPTQGTVSIDPATGELTFTPALNFHGADSLTYQVCDNGTPAQCATATVYLTVNAVNDAPQANDDLATTSEDTPVLIDILANDTDTADVGGAVDPTSVTIVTQPTQGTVTIDPATGELTFTPALNFHGADSLTYQVCDNGTPAQCATAKVYLTISSVNDAPQANDDLATTSEDTPVLIDILANDTDTADVGGAVDPTSVTIVTQPTQGTVTIDPATGELTFTPALNFYGADSLTYQVCDNGTPAQCATAKVYLTISSVNDAPQANDDLATTSEDTPVLIDILANDTDTADVGGAVDPTSVTITTQPTQGTVTIDPATGELTFTPALNFYGADSLTYQVCDNGTPVQCATAKVYLTVNAVNDAPQANDDLATTSEDTPVLIDILANDTDTADVGGAVDPTSVTITTQPTQGTVTIDPATGELTFTPALNFNGTDSLTYQVCDNGTPTQCATAKVYLTISSVNDAPQANDDTAVTNDITPVVIDVVANDTDTADVGGAVDPTSVTITTQPTQGTVTIDPATGELTFTPALNFNGADSLTYQVCDNGTPAQCATAKVYLTISSVNDAPQANDDLATTSEDTPVLIDILANDTDTADVGGVVDPTSVTIVTQPTQGTVTNDPATGELTFTPALNFYGADSLTYQVCDNGTPAQCATAKVYLTVNSVNDAPQANDDTAVTNDITPVVIDVVANDTDTADVGGAIDPTSVTVVTQPTLGTVTVDPVTGAVTYTPIQGQSGTDSLEYRVCDTGTPPACNTAWVYLTVQGVPALLPDYDTVTAGFSVAVEVLANDSDPDGDLDASSLRLTVNNAPQHGTAVVNSSTGAIDYSAQATQTVIDSFGYVLCDLAGNCDSTTVYMQIYAYPVASNGGPYCATEPTFTLQTSTVAGATYTWYKSGQAAAVGAGNPLTLAMSPQAGGDYYVVARVNGYDLEPSAMTTVQVDALPAAQAYAGAAIELCAGETSAQLTATLPAGTTGLWTTASGISIADGTAAQTTAFNIPAGSHELIWTLSAGACVNFDADTLDLTVKSAVQAPTLAAQYTGCEGDNLVLTTSTTYTGATYAWTGPNGFASTAASPILTAITALDTGQYQVTLTYDGCTAAPASTQVAVTPRPSTPVISPQGITCAGDAITLNTTATAATYSWLSPNGDTLATAVPSLTVAASAAQYGSGSWQLATTSAQGCTSLWSNPVSVTVQPRPATPTANATPSVCVGDNIALSGPAIANATYAWTGPNGYTAAVQNPVIPNVDTSASGMYQLQVTVNGCSATQAGQVAVVVHPTPVVNLMPIDTFCEGSDVLLTADSLAGALYTWTGPNGFSLQNQTTPSLTFLSATPSLTGTYTLTIHSPQGCNSLPTSLYLPIQAKPLTPTVTGASDYCAGDAIVLNTQPYTGTPLSYEWFFNGASLGTNTAPQWTINAATLADSGDYTVQVQHDGCLSDVSAPLNVSVHAAPTDPLASFTYSLASACEGGTLTLQAQGDPSHSYQWTGPNGFTANVASPDIFNATPLANGHYTVTVTNGQCSTTSSTSVAFLVERPDEPIINSTGPVCEGGSITLSTQLYSDPSIAFTWLSPNGSPQSTTANQWTLSPVALADTGYYRVTVTQGQCANTSDSFYVQVNALPQPFAPVANDSLCQGDTLHLQSGTSDPSIASYQWTGPAGFSAQTAQVQVNSIQPAQSGSYSLTVQTAAGCTRTESVQVYVAPRPITPTLVANTPVCEGGQLVLNTSPYTGGTAGYTWYLANDTVTTSVANLIVNNVSAAAAGTASLQVTVDGCRSLLSPSVPIVVQSAPAAPTLSTNATAAQPLCEGGRLMISATGVTSGSYQWTGPNGFFSTQSGVVIDPAMAADSGQYQLVVTTGGCSSPAATITAYIVPTPALPVADNSGPVCVGDSVALLVMNPNVNATYEWYTAPAGTLLGTGDTVLFASATTALEGDYYVIAVQQGCTTSPSNLTFVQVDAPASDLAYGGEDVVVCDETEAILEAVAPVQASGRWAALNGGRIITPTQTRTMVTQLPFGESQMLWMLSSGACINYDVDTVTVLNVQPPVAVDDAVTIPYTDVATIDVLANDTWYQVPIAVDVLTLPAEGTVTPSVPVGVLEYAPLGSYVGVDVFTYVLSSTICPELQDTAEVLVTLEAEAGCNPPTIFTPNNDGVNDAFFIDCVSGAQASIAVFNRYGVPVFESEDYQNDWEGTYQGQPLPEGTYFYILRLAPSQQELQGYIIIRR